jgi:OmpA-OmpF porin, OOP family
MKIIVFFVLLFFTLVNYAQYLLDSSFEDIFECPQPTQLTLAIWYRPSFGTSDNFCSCFTPNDLFLSPPLQNKQAYEGDCFIGLIMYENGAPNYREFLETKIDKQLIPGKEYCVSLYVVGSTNCNYSVNGFSVGFREDSTYQQTGAIMEVDTFYRFTNEVIKDTLNWQKLSLRFIAKGNEQYLSIGQHSKQEDVLVDSFNATGPPLYLLPYAYYFFDMITLKECPPDPVAHFSVYPNPSAEGTLYVSNYADTSTVLHLYNTLGQRVAVRELPAGENGLVAFEGLAVGVYIVVYQTANGYREEKKVVVLQ